MRILLINIVIAPIIACHFLHAQTLFQIDFENGLKATGAAPELPIGVAGGGYEVNDKNSNKSIGINLSGGFAAQGKNCMELGSFAMWHIAQNHIANGRLSFWIMPLALPSENQSSEIIWGGDNAKPFQTFSINVLHDGTIKANYSSFQNNGQFLSGVISKDAIRPREWNHVDFTWGDSGQRIYINGKLSASNSERFPASFLQDLKFGGLPGYYDNIELSASTKVDPIALPSVKWQPTTPILKDFLAIEDAAHQLTEKAPKGSDAYCRGLVISQVLRMSWGTALQVPASALTLDNLAWMKEVLAKTRPSLRSGEIPVPVFDAKIPLVIEAGRIMQGGKPTFLIGNFSPTSIDSEIGFNFCNALMPGPGDIFPAPQGIINSGTGLAKSIDDATRDNKVTDVLLSLVVPSWAGRLDPHAFEGGAGWFNYNVESLAVTGMFRAAADAIVPAIRGHAATVIINLANEPGSSGFSPTTTTPGWQTWLMAKHRSIGELNSAWGTDFADFTDVQGPPYIKAEGVGLADPGGLDVPTDALVLGQWYDWCIFNQQRYARFFRTVRDDIKGNRPDLLFTIKWLSNFSGWWKSIGYGLNPYDITKLLDISGSDFWSVYAGLDPKNYWAMWWEDPMRTCDLLKSIAPDKPIDNSEDHLLRGDDETAPALKYGTYRDVIPWQHFYTALWEQAIHGVAGAELWTYWESGKGFNLNERAKALDATSQAARDLRRYAREITAIANVRPKIALLLSSAGLAWAPKEHLAASTLAYKAMNLIGLPVGYMLEEMLPDDAMARYDVLVVPGARHISRAMNDAIEKYVAGGKTVIVLGPVPIADEYNKPIKFPASAIVWSDIVPPDEKEQTSFDGLRPKSTSSHDDVTRKLQVRLADELQKLRMVPQVDIRQGNSLPFGVEWRSVEIDGTIVVNLCNFSNQAQKVSLKTKGLSLRGINLLDGASVAGDLELKPLEVALIRVQ
ncbi:hypothetical protein BH09VER1_BH09VER1_17320 [soil metagenome]